MSLKNTLTISGKIAAIAVVISSASAFSQTNGVQFADDAAYTNSAGWYSGVTAHDSWLNREVYSATGRITTAKQFLPHSQDIDFFVRHLQKQYSNDMRTVEGRVKWHGKPIAQEIDTNRLYKIERYADGTVHVAPFHPPQSFASKTNSPAWRAKAERRKAKLAAQRARIAAGKSVVPGLKEARLATFDAKNTESNVTVNVNIGGK